MIVYDGLKSDFLHSVEEDTIAVADKEGFIYLTPSGKEIAEMIYERHQLLTDWLVRLGVDEKIASEDACRIEHYISKESFEAIKKIITQS